MSLKFLRTLLIPALFFCSCAGNKEIAKAEPAKPLPPKPKVFACGFSESIFEGKLPCFGNDCGDNGAPLTQLIFHEDQTFEKRLLSETGILRTEGTWNIDQDCIITLYYAVKTKPEFYRLKAAAMIKLNAQKEEHEAFIDQYILLKK